MLGLMVAISFRENDESAVSRHITAISAKERHPSEGWGPSTINRFQPALE
ncbi:hypothetical protein OAD57_01725 [Porticoccaceae bacterium]|nr:hypothetical protein [Porticoccaceae bacterium]MDC0000033.1 hypothetical protein [Porticoccaceae bacterium]